MLLVIKKMFRYIKWIYMQYLLNTALYMLEPSEVKVFNFVFLFLLVIALYSTYIFAPPMIFAFVNWFLQNDNDNLSTI
jgi:preprotein translocase subunit SecF